jgi:hypothetical protein
MQLLIPSVFALLATNHLHMKIRSNMVFIVFLVN